MSTMRVLVTGGSGFVGRHAAAALEAARVSAHLLRREECNLLREAPSSLLQSIRPTHLLHLAWYAVPGKFYTADENYGWVHATVELARAFVEAGGRRIVVAGSCAEYDDRFGYCREELTPCEPRTPYGAAKDAARRLLQSYVASTEASMAWGRLFFLYGPGEQSQRLVPSVIRSLLRGEEARCTEGTQARDFLHVADAAAALVALLDSDVAGPVNIASGQPVAVRDVARTIAKQLGACDRLRLGAVPMRDEPPMIAGDSARLRRETGWQPRFDLDSGIADTIAWWRSHER